MRGLDTNVLIRHIVQDDPILSPRATRLIEHELTEDDPGFISLVTMAEIAWVLANSYYLPSLQIATIIEAVLQTEVFVIQNEEQIHMAVETVRAGQASFPDALIAALGQWAGCAATLTFDKKASRLAEFQLL